MGEQEYTTMRVAFDVHGVLDTHEEYRALMRSLYELHHTIYIISGQPLDIEMMDLLEKHDLTDHHHHYMSVETFLLEEDIHGYTITEKGKFWIDEVWDPVKSIICDQEGIDMIFDNSPSYAETFKHVDTHFNLVIDKNKTLANKR
jgi:hypothetical protein